MTGFFLSLIVSAVLQYIIYCDVHVCVHVITVMSLKSVPHINGFGSYILSYCSIINNVYIIEYIITWRFQFYYYKLNSNMQVQIIIIFFLTNVYVINFMIVMSINQCVILHVLAVSYPSTLWFFLSLKVLLFCYNVKNNIIHHNK